MLIGDWLPYPPPSYIYIGFGLKKNKFWMVDIKRISAEHQFDRFQSIDFMNLFLLHSLKSGFWISQFLVLSFFFPTHSELSVFVFLNKMARDPQ